MANCVLCGQKLGMFDKVKIDFHNTKQSVCSDCANRLDNTVGPERAELFRQILDSPYLENGEDIRADINTGKRCSVRQAGLGRTFPQEEKQSTSKRSKKVPWEK